MNADAINPELKLFNTLGGRSVQTLSPRHPYFKALNDRPIQVPYHSIIGDRGRGDTPESSDGIVPYWSSHLNGAQSEIIVLCKVGGRSQRAAEFLASRNFPHVSNLTGGLAAWGRDIDPSLSDY